VAGLKGQCHEDFAVLDQFWAKIIPLRLYSLTKCFYKASTKVWNEFYQRGLTIIAELQRARRASEAPWVRKIGNPSSRENLVMTSAYERANVRPSVRPSRLWGRGRGVSRSSSPSPIRETKECHLSLAVFWRKVAKTLISICHVNKQSDRLI